MGNAIGENKYPYEMELAYIGSEIHSLSLWGYNPGKVSHRSGSSGMKKDTLMAVRLFPKNRKKGGKEKKRGKKMASKIRDWEKMARFVCLEKGERRNVSRHTEWKKSGIDFYGLTRWG